MSRRNETENADLRRSLRRCSPGRGLPLPDPRRGRRRRKLDLIQADHAVTLSLSMTHRQSASTAPCQNPTSTPSTCHPPEPSRSASPARPAKAGHGTARRPGSRSPVPSDNARSSQSATAALPPGLLRPWPVGPTDLRHAAVSLWLAAGVPPPRGASVNRNYSPLPSDHDSRARCQS